MINIVKTSIPEHIKARRGQFAIGRPVVWQELYDVLEKAVIGDEFRVNLPNKKQVQKAQGACNSRHLKNKVPTLRFMTTTDQLKDGTYDLYVEVLKR